MTVLLFQGTLYLLTDLNDGIVHKARTTTGIKLRRRFHQPNVPLANQVVELQPTSPVLCSHLHDKAQVSFHQLAECIAVASLDTLRELPFLVGRQQLLTSDFIQIEVQSLVFHTKKGSLSAKIQLFFVLLRHQRKKLSRCK